jgi:hypothetical protein
MKKCNNPKCNILEPLFNKNKNNKDGLSNRCKNCVNKSVKTSYNKNSKYYSQKESERNKIWREKNPELYEVQKNKWNSKYKEEDYWLNYYKKNKEKFQKYSQKKEVIEQRKLRWKERYYNDISFRLKEIMKSNFHLFFKDKGKTKNLSFTKVINYTYNELKSHLEQNFRKGMNWDNFGELWEIHHIKPQNMFNGENKKDIQECWGLNNLIPLWKTNVISYEMGDNTIGNRNVPKDIIYQP